METPPITPTLTGRIREKASNVAGTLWVVSVAILVVVFVVRERAEISRTATALRAASAWWLLSALAAGFTTMGVLGLAMRPLLGRFGYRLGWLTLVRADLRRHVVGTVVPVGGPAATLALVRVLARRGVPSADALYVALLNSLLSYASFVLFLIPALALLAAGGHASALTLVAAGALLSLFTLMAAAMLALVRSGGRPPRWFGRLPARFGAERLPAFARQASAHGLRPRDLVAPLSLNMLVEVLGVASLYACLRAVGWHASLTTAIAGYAVGTLFLLIAPVMQGLGAVELSMTIALQGFGVPSGTALAAVLLYRAAVIWLPFVFGVALEAGDRPELRRASAHLPAVLTGFTGIVAVASVLPRHVAHRFDRVGDYSFVEASDLSRHLTLIAGFFLLFLSWSLWRRKRVAWVAAVALLAVMLPAHLLKRHDQSASVLAAVNLAALVVHRDRFRVKSDLPTMRQGLIRFGLSLLFALAYGTLGFFLIDERAFDVDFSLVDALGRTLRLFFSLGDSGLTPHTRYARWFLDSLQIVGVLALVYALFSLVRPVVWRRTTLVGERVRAREMIERWGDSALDFFKWYPDKVFFFSSAGDGVVSYRVALGVAVALGDPVADGPRAFARVLDEFLDFCDANDWKVVFHQVPPTRLAAYRQAGLAALKIGEDAVVNLETFSLSGRAMKSLRAVVNRLERESYRSVYYPAPLDDATIRRLREVSDEWLTIHGRRERGFTLGQFVEEYLRATPVMTVEDAAGRVVAFANVIPDGVEGEATVDLMRRRAAPSGAMDLLTIRLFEHCRARGFRAFGLGMAPFSEVGSTSGARVPERAAHLFYERFNRFFAYKGLREYKDKFQPRWEPRYIVYQSEATLPLIALALVRVTEAENAAGDFGIFQRVPDRPSSAPTQPWSGTATSGEPA